MHSTYEPDDPYAWLDANPWFLPLILAIGRQRQTSHTVITLLLIVLSSTIYHCCYKTTLELRQEVKRLTNKEIRNMTVSEYESRAMNAVSKELVRQEKEAKKKENDTEQA